MGKTQRELVNGKATQGLNVLKPAAYRYTDALPPESAMLEELLKGIEIQQLFESYYNLLNIPVAVIDLKANVLLSSRWRRICTQFHRVHPATCARCVESDTKLALQLREGKNCAIYECQNGLTDCASPIIMGGQHVANVFIGQFLTHRPDEAWFRRQAEQCNFDVDEYLGALREVPVVEAAKIPAILDLLARMTRVITKLGADRNRAMASQARQAIVFDMIPQSVFWKDVEGRYLGCNAAFARAAGLARPEDIVGRTDFDLPWPRKEAEAYRADDLEVISGNRPRLHRVEPLQQADGSRLVVDTCKIPLVDASRRVGGVVGIYEDITERVLADETLRDSEEKYRVLYESSRDAIMMLSPPAWRFTVVNPRAVELFAGRDAAEFMAVDPWNLSPEHQPDGEPSRQKAVRMIETAMERGTHFFEWTHKRFSGEEFLATVDLTRMLYRGQVQLQATVRDITAQRRAEEEVWKLSKALEQSPVAVLITDRNGSIEYVNPRFTQLTGYSLQEARGKNPRILRSGETPEETYRELWETVLAGGEWRGEFHNKRKDGTLFWERASISPIRDASGNITHLLAVKDDIGAWKDLEGQLRQAQKMEAVGRLAGGVAHDFNNLLTIINGYSQLLLERSGASDPRTAQLQEIRNAGERAASMTRQLLAFSRKQVIEPRTVDLNSLLANLEKMLRRLIGEDIELRTVPGQHLGCIRADPGQIEQVILNLTVNARDAMPAGGKLTLETANTELDETYTRAYPDVVAGRFVMLAVSDNGCGISTATLPHVFEPFCTTKGAGKGTGLGLSTVYGIVKQARGHVSVYSEVGHGTTFKVYFPRLDQSAEEVPEQKGLPTSVSGTETILVAEDEPAVRSLVGDSLQAQGYTVLLADSPAEAVTLANRHSGPIHLLLTDVIMPGLSGSELANHLRFERPEMKVLFMSGYTGEAIAHHGVVNEGVAFLSKPFTCDALLGKVRAVLNEPHPV